MFGWLAKAIAFFYGVWPSYGGAIILLTLVIMVLLLPLTLKGTRSMIEMQRLQPEMKKLQNRYKDDRQKLNEELMKFYKENNISPLGGCLPLFIQLPIFWILYEVLLGLTHRGPFGGDVGAAVGVGSHNIFGAAGVFDPKYLSHSSQLYQDLHHTRQMHSFGIDLAQSVTSSLGSGLVHALPFIVLLLVVVATTYIQQWQIQRRSGAGQSAQQQMMMKVMPLAFSVIYIVIPAGVVLYFLVSNLFRIAQQGFLTRTMAAEGLPIPAPATDQPKGLRALWNSLTEQATSRAPQRPAPSKGGSRAKAERRPATAKASKGAGAKGTTSAGRGKANGARQAAGRTAEGQNGKPAAGKKGGAQRGDAKGGAGPRSSKAKAGKAKAGKAQKNRASKGPGTVSPSSQAQRGRDRAAAERPPSKSSTALRAAETDGDGSAAKSPSRKTPSRKSPQPPNRGRDKRKRK